MITYAVHSQDSGQGFERVAAWQLMTICLYDFQEQNCTLDYYENSAQESYLA